MAVRTKLQPRRSRKRSGDVGKTLPFSAAESARQFARKDLKASIKLDRTTINSSFKKLRKKKGL